MGRIYEDLGQIEKAIECYSKAYEVRPYPDDKAASFNIFLARRKLEEQREKEKDKDLK